MAALSTNEIKMNGTSISIVNLTTKTANGAVAQIVLSDANTIGVYDGDHTSTAASPILATIGVDSGTSLKAESLTLTNYGTSYSWILDSDGLVSVQGTAGKDSFIINDVNSGAKVTLGGGADSIQFINTGAADETISVTDSVTAGASLNVSNTNTNVTIAAASDIAGSGFSGKKTGGITFTGATGHATLASSSGMSGGMFSLGGAAASINFDVSGGSLVLGGTNADTLANVNVTGGSLYISDTTGTDVIESLTSGDEGYLNFGDPTATVSLVAGPNSSVIKNSYNAGTFTAASDGELTLKNATVGGALSINEKASSKNSTVVIDSLGAAVTHTLGSGTLNLTVEDAGVNATKYYELVDNSGTPTSSATIFGGKMTVKDTDNKLVLGAQDADGVNWNIGGTTGTIVASTGSTGTDKVTLSGTQTNSVDIVTGSGDDVFTFTSGLTATAATTGMTVKGGKGADTYDLTGIGSGTTEKKIYVTDFGVGAKKATEDSSTKGYDKIFVGSFNEKTDYKFIADTTGASVLIVGGVTFSVENGKYVKIGTGDSLGAENEKWTAYLAKNGELIKAADVTDDSSTTDAQTGDYRLSDAAAKDNYDNVTIDENAPSGDTTLINTAFDAANTNSVKKLTVNKQDWSASKAIDMTSKGISFVEVKEGAAPAGEIKMGKSNENNILLMDSAADLSNVNFSDYKSTKDAIISSVDLDKKYADSLAATATDTTNFISAEDGSFGTDLMTKNGALVASSVKGGMYAAKYREADIIDGSVQDINNEILVVAGSKAEGTFDGSNLATQVFALTNNNDTVADSVKGSKYADVFVAGEGDTVDGGAGNDRIYTDNQKVTVNLATGTTADNDTIYGWKTGTGTIQLAGGENFSNISVGEFDTANGSFNVADGTGSKTFGTFMVTNGLTASGGILTTFKNGDGTSKKALIYDGDDTAGFNGATGKYADSLAAAKLFVASENGKGQLSFEGSGKGNIFLGHSDDGADEFGDSAVYVNVKNVKSDTVGSAWLFGGATAATLQAGGDADSIWGGGKNVDTLISNDTYRTFFGTTNGSGVDVVQKFKTGADAFGESTDTDVIYFVDGVDMSAMKVSNNQFIVGSNSSSGLAIDLGTIAGDDTTGGALITYALGLGGAKNVAKVDVTTDANADGEITFTEDAQLYIGRGDKSTVTFGKNNDNPVRFGFDSQYSGYNVRNLDGSEAVAGSIINGSTDRAQRVVASEKGASSIAGGFGDGFVDGNSDTLVGGNGDDFKTTFFVGKDMGSDQILKLSGNDTVVFLNTKLSDITNDVNAGTYGKTMSVSFNTGSRVTINSDSNIADLEGVTLQLADGSFKYDATAKSWVNANA